MVFLLDNSLRRGPVRHYSGFAFPVSDSEKPLSPRKLPAQARSRRTVDWILEGAARVFRREGFAATTNRIAEEAGVSVGTLYEYFPNKEALLAALAERHVEEAEGRIGAALDTGGTAGELVESLQAAVLASHRYPSQALELVGDPRLGEHLKRRADTLQTRALAALEASVRATGLAEPETRARASFAVGVELASRALYQTEDRAEQVRLARHFLEMARRHLTGTRRL